MSFPFSFSPVHHRKYYVICAAITIFYSIKNGSNIHLKKVIALGKLATTYYLDIQSHFANLLFIVEFVITDIYVANRLRV